MLNKNLSVHLQDFPDLSFVPDEKDLVNDMDMVRAICSTALFIRDKQNLRVRLPLNKLTIIGKISKNIMDYQDIIADEVNVKNIEILSEIGDWAEFKLQINFKKVGVKFGSKMKEISAAARDGKWRQIENREAIEIAGEILEDDDYEIKLITKDAASIAPLPSNNCLVMLDINVTPELEMEGLARDLVRVIQQNRKDADLNISDRIKIKLFAPAKINEMVKIYENYIKEQTLTDEFTMVNDKNSITCQYKFHNKIEEMELDLGIDL